MSVYSVVPVLMQYPPIQHIITHVIAQACIYTVVCIFTYNHTAVIDLSSIYFLIYTNADNSNGIKILIINEIVFQLSSSNANKVFFYAMKIG